MDVTQEAVRDVCTDAVFERGENYLAEGRIREIPPSLFHFLTLTLSVVVFVENARPHVCAVTDDIFRNIAIQVVSDTATPEGVWTFTREAAEGGSILHRFATLRIAVVWTRSSRNIGLAYRDLTNTRSVSLCVFSFAFVRSPTLRRQSRNS